MKAYVLMMLLASSTSQAYKLSYRKSQDMVQLNTKGNPEVSDILSFADNKDYVHSEKSTLYEEDFHDTDKYTMKPSEYQKMMQKQDEDEQKKKDEEMAKESYKKVEEAAMKKHYEDLVDMVAEGKPDPEEEMQKAQEKKHQEMLKKVAEANKKQEEQEKKAEEDKKKLDLGQVQELVEKFEPVNGESARMIDQMQVIAAQFQRSQQIQDYEKVKDLHHQLRVNYNLNPDAIKPNLDVTSLVKQGFNDFPDIAGNDYAIEQMNHVKAAQTNLETNVENSSLAQALIQEIQSSSKNLETQYKDYWNNPFSTVVTEAKQLIQKDTTVDESDE